MSEFYDLFGGNLEPPPSPYVPPPVTSPPPTTTTPEPQHISLPISIGSVESLPYGTQPYVELDEESTPTNLILNWGIETGAQGIQGERGPKGDDGGLDLETEIRLLAVESGLGIVQGEVSTITSALGGITSDIAGLNTAVATISAEVDTLQAEFADLEPRVIALKEKTAVQSYTGISTNFASNVVVIGDVADYIYTTVFSGQPSFGIIRQFG